MTEYISQIEQNHLWICDSIDEKMEAKKATADRRLDGFYMPPAPAETSTKRDSFDLARGFRTDGGPTRLVDIRWSIADDGKEYSQEEILELAKQALEMKKRSTM